MRLEKVSIELMGSSFNRIMLIQLSLADLSVDEVVSP